MSRVADVIKQKEDRELLSTLIQSALETQRIPKKRAADAAGIKPSHFSQVLSGQKSLGKEKLVALARVLNIPYKKILLAGGYSANDLQTIELQNILTPVISREPIQVITDPRFPDSSLFLWIFSQQPFRSLGAECKIVTSDWRNVPETVANEKYAIGFYNRRAQTTIDKKRISNLAYWIDLCLYRGYAICARAGIQNPPKTLSAANAYIAELINECRREKKRNPIIISMGADTVWRLKNSLNPFLRPEHITTRTFGNPDFALQQFLNGVGDLFVGGLPQRMAAVKAGCIEILNSEMNPLLFSLNALICTELMIKEQKSLLIAASALWFETLVKLQNDPVFRSNTIQEIMHILDEFQVKGHTLYASLLDECFSTANGTHEFFPQSPTDLLDELLRVLQRISLVTSKEEFVGTLQTLQETLRKELDE